jgi:hypothetical protein
LLQKAQEAAAQTTTAGGGVDIHAFDLRHLGTQKAEATAGDGDAVEDGHDEGSLRERKVLDRHRAGSCSTVATDHLGHELVLQMARPGMVEGDDRHDDLGPGVIINHSGMSIMI